MKRQILLFICIYGIVSCTTPISHEEVFKKLKEIDFTKHKNYSVVDFRESNYYHVRYNDSSYFVVMPVHSDSIVRIERYIIDELTAQEIDSLMGKGPFKINVPLVSDAVSPINDICLTYRKTWQLAHKQIKLCPIHVDANGNIMMSIYWKRTKTYYNVYIPVDDNLKELNSFSFGDCTESSYTNDYIKIEEHLYYREYKN